MYNEIAKIEKMVEENYCGRGNVSANTHVSANTNVSTNFNINANNNLNRIETLDSLDHDSQNNNKMSPLPS